MLFKVMGNWQDFKAGFASRLFRHRKVKLKNGQREE